MIFLDTPAIAPGFDTTWANLPGPAEPPPSQEDVPSAEPDHEDMSPESIYALFNRLHAEAEGYEEETDDAACEKAPVGVATAFPGTTPANIQAGSGNPFEWPPEEDGAAEECDPPTPSAKEQEADEWWLRATEFANWAWNWLVVRTDRYGCHKANGGRRASCVDLPSERVLTKAALIKHARATGATSVVGIYTTRRDDGESCGKWIAIDIDRHGKEGDAEEETTARAAHAWHERAKARGLHSLLMRSNNDGGYHIWIIFEEPVPAKTLRETGRWLIQDWRETGFTSEPEVFPKQDTITEEGIGSYGNWVRLPGRHHKRDFWTQVWDGREWVRGSRAIDVMISTVGGPANRIPHAEIALWATQAAERTAKAGKPAPAVEVAARVGAMPAPTQSVRPPVRACQPKDERKQTPLPRVRRGDPRTLCEAMVARFPISATEKRSNQSGKCVSYMVRERYDDESIVSTMRLWWQYFYGLGLTKTDQAESEANVIRWIKCAESSDGFRGWADEWHVSNIADVCLEAWQIASIIDQHTQHTNTPNARAPFIAARFSVGSVIAYKPRVACKRKYDVLYVETLVRFATYCLRDLCLQTIRLTNEQLRQVMSATRLAEGGKPLRSKDTLGALKDRYVDRPGKPATVVSLLEETQVGQRGTKSNPGTPSEFRITGLARFLPDDILGYVDQNRRITQEGPSETAGTIAMPIDVIPAVPQSLIALRAV